MASDDSNTSESQIEELKQKAAEAFKRFKKKPNYPEVHLRVIRECEDLNEKVGSKLPTPHLPSQERLAYALQIFDAWASNYANLVSNIDDHEDFTALLQSYERKAWEIYRGDVKIEPLSRNSALLDIKNRSWHWYKESLKQLIPTAPPQNSSTNNPSPRRAYRQEIKSWMTRKNISKLDIAARQLGVGLSTLKSIMSDKGDRRYSQETLRNVLNKIGITAGDAGSLTGE